MPSCNCSQCTQKSSARDSSKRDSRCKCKRRDSPKRKQCSCDCNSCHYRTLPTCKRDDNDDEDDIQPECNSQTHHVTIIVKSTK